jgi:hypothetical protein
MGKTQLGPWLFPALARARFALVAVAGGNAMIDIAPILRLPPEPPNPPHHLKPARLHGCASRMKIFERADPAREAMGISD